MNHVFYLIIIAFVISIGQSVLIWQLRRDLTEEIRARREETNGLKKCIQGLLGAQKTTTETMGMIAKVIK